MCCFKFSTHTHTHTHTHNRGSSTIAGVPRYRRNFAKKVIYSCPFKKKKKETDSGDIVVRQASEFLHFLVCIVVQGIKIKFLLLC